MSEKSSCGLFLNPILKNMVKLAPFSLYEKGTKIFKHKREQPFKTMKGGGSTLIFSCIIIPSAPPTLQQPSMSLNSRNDKLPLAYMLYLGRREQLECLFSYNSIDSAFWNKKRKAALFKEKLLQLLPF